MVAAGVDPLAPGAEPLWDSGSVATDRAEVRYAGPEPQARTEYVWRVRVVDERGRTSGWSAPARWETGIEDWSARWIGAGPDPAVGTSLDSIRDVPPVQRIVAGRVRTTFEVPDRARVRRAALTVCGGSAWLNGTDVTTGDVTAVVQTGANVLAVAGDTDTLVARLRVDVEDGPPIVAQTDGRWRSAPAGTAGWEQPGVDDSAWPRAEALGLHGVPPHGREPQSHRPSPYLRREFTVDSPIRTARLHVSALGCYELRLNGRRVGADHLAPGWTDYHRRVAYQTYDVTDDLTAGANRIDAVLGDGWYAGNVCWFGTFQYGPTRLLLAQLEIDHADGRRTVIGTDDSWSVGEGPLRYADLQNGVVHDARVEPGNWRPATVDTPDCGPVEPATAPPIRVTERLHPREVRRRPDGRILVDFGQNLVGWVRLRLRGRRGDRILLQHAEALDAAGELYTTALRAATQTDEFVLAGDDAGETCEPTFTAHGFRYVEIHGVRGAIDATALVAHADMTPTGEFHCSNPDLDRLQQNIVWSQRGNFLSVPTDCPQRDERLGWTGDAQVFAATAAFNYDVRTFLDKWLTDLTDAQRPDGAVSDVAPDVIGWMGDRDWAGNAGWGDAIAVVPAVLFSRYGLRPDRVYPAVVRWLDWLWRDSVAGLRTAKPYGDWLAVTPTPDALVATAYFARTAGLAAELARVVGADPTPHEERYALVRKAFRDAFVEGGGRVVSDTQTAYVLSLQAGLLDEAEIPRAVERLVAEIESRRDHLTTGFLGTPHLLDALTDGGRIDVAYRLLLQDTYPSWLYPVHNGATTIWERWDSWSDSRGFQDPDMTSFNHYAYGAVGDWIYRTVGGIEPAAPGYRAISIRPRPGGGLTWARASYESVHGRITSAWRVDGDTITLDVTVPPNTTARVRLPDGATHQVGSGDHTFSGRLHPLPDDAALVDGHHPVDPLQ